MSEDNIVGVLRAVERGLVRHAHPFSWICTPDADHVDARTLQRALQQDLISVEKNADGEPRPVRLTEAGLARLARERG